MKKVIGFLIFVAIGLMIVFYLWSNPKTTNMLGNTIYDFIKDLFAGEVVAYDKNDRINSLQIELSDFYYNTLTEDQKYIYSSIVQSVKKLNTTVSLKGYKVDESEQVTKDIDAAISAFFADHPEVFYLDNKYYVSTNTSFLGKRREIQLKYLVANKNELNQQLDAVSGRIQTIMSKALDLHGVDAEIVIHDTLMADTTYYEYENIEDLPINTHTIYGTLVEKEAVCDGFAKTLQILLDKIHLQSIIVLGALENEAHAWNLVKLEDEQWYQLDFTSNKSVKNKGIEGNILIHSYFNVTTEELAKSHKFDNKDIIPVAKATKYNYYIYKNLYISSTEDFSLKFKKILDGNLIPGFVEFKVDPYCGGVSGDIVDVLQNKKYDEYSNGNKITYYKILNTYIIMKNK